MNPWTRIRIALSSCVKAGMLLLLAAGLIVMIAMIVYGVGTAVITWSWPVDPVAQSGVLIAALLTLTIGVGSAVTPTARWYKKQERKWNDKHGLEG